MGACASYPGNGFYYADQNMMRNQMLAEEAAINNQMALQREARILRQAELGGAQQRLLREEQNLLVQEEIVAAETGMMNGGNMALQNELIVEEEMALAGGAGQGMFLPTNNMMGFQPQGLMVESEMVAEQAAINQMVIEEDMAVATMGVGGPMPVF